MAALSRREFLGAAGAAAILPALPSTLFATTPTETPLHGLSAFGDLKYAAGFDHFDYASPDAPQGGTFNFSPPNWLWNQNPDTFNTLNTFVPNGDAPPRMEMCFDSLMTRSLDEPDAVYGLTAETVSISADRNTFEFSLRPQARFHDGSPLTAEDVAYTYNLFKQKAHPGLRLSLGRMTEAVAVDPRTFRLTFSGEQSDRTILSVVGYPIVSKAFFEANPFDGSQLNPPLGCGAYKVGTFRPAQFIEYDRVVDYWGKDLGVNRGLGHFDRIRLEFYRDRQAAFEAFKKGNVLYRQEFTSRTWATGYDFPAITQGKVIKREFPRELQPSLQAWAINQRRDRFKDARVREAIGLCFDFEWTKRNLFYDAYERSHSLFENSEFVATGLPSPEEQALLEPLRGRIPEETFGEPVMQPITDGTGRDRRLLRRGIDLLGQAGWRKPDGSAFVVNEKGERLTLEILVNDEVFIRIDSPFIENMKTIGIDASIRLVDAAQYTVRQSDFDFDMISIAASMSATPTYDDLEQFFHSSAAAMKGSRNLPGTADPAVDELLTAVSKVADRPALVAAIRALDRVLRARRDWIPNWHAANHRAAYWDIYGFREPKPDYGFPVEALWWFDAEKARAIGKL
ncbi:extracellular solute-binding protein [Mesorhizobium australicum]|uniref:Microcin C transport system substrate-binding protein n=1 Tax=Mesorhizobium australicum TaxID=536018 RepID=A0A1X7NBP9_9HYPH|nr:extracellular solute-binding protein [Mesorhizobium australicum]SMH35056.1 microcin C transport system substrate-binding protein [Mesorhizobium australicum]